MQHADPFIALTDKAWFDYLASIAEHGCVDEVNFWSPRSTAPLKRMAPGAPVFLRLKKPHYAIAGYGFFAHFTLLDLDAAWSMFAEKNGDPNKLRFLDRIGEYRGRDMRDSHAERDPLGCTILRDVHFWPPDRWLSWGSAQGWHNNSVRGQTEHDPVRASNLLARIQLDQISEPEEFAAEFRLLEVDERQVVLAKSIRREGQGAFRSRLLDAYGKRCAITGERTEPVLDAAHVQPYLGPRSNHLQNGLLLTKEFHALFDEGLVTITPDYLVRVSPKIRERWSNGRRYYEFNGRRLAQVPDAAGSRPSTEALTWHNKHLFVA